MDGVTILILILACLFTKYAFGEEKPKKKIRRRNSKLKRYKLDFK